MKVEAREFLQNTGIDEVNEEALYLLIPSPQGIPLEDLSPLIESLERAYRTLLSVSIDPFLRDRIGTPKSLRFRGPLTRSINVRYNRYVPKEPEPPDLAEAKVDNLAVKGWVSETSLKFSLPAMTIDEPTLLDVSELPHEGVREFYARRIAITRAKISSPGFVEIIGDPLTLAAILSFLLGLLKLRQLERRDKEGALIDKKKNARNNALALRKLGFSVEQISGLNEYLDKDLGTILRELEKGRIVLAPGEELEAKGILSPHEDEKQQII